MRDPQGNRKLPSFDWLSLFSELLIRVRIEPHGDWEQSRVMCRSKKYVAKPYNRKETR